jgi:hypothetical protein
MLAGRGLDDGSTDVRVIDRQGSRQDEHFTEGEPDLEPPEELAVLEVDEEARREEDLDNRVDLEEEMDEEVLETSLDHLVHDADDDDDGVGADGPVATVALLVGEATDVDDLEIEDLEDRDESLDRLLREKLAGDEEPDGDDVGSGVDADTVVEIVGVTVSACGPDEFVCPACFLVRHRAQRSNGPGSRCHDCDE